MEIVSEKISIFKQNEIQANKVVTVALLLTELAMVLVWIFFQANVFYMPGGDPNRLLFFNIALNMAAVGIARHHKYRRWFVKFILMAVVIFSYAMLDAVFTYNAHILMIIPVVLSTRYYKGGYTVKVAAISTVAFLLSAIWGANHGLMDLNFLKLPPGTVIEIGEDVWLSDALEGVAYDKNSMILNVLCYSFFIKLLFSIIVDVVCFMVAKQGRIMILKQNELNKEAVRMNEELSLATKIQTNMLPDIEPPFLGNESFDLYAFMEPAREVGGDLYDFFFIDDDHLALVIADVSGKGVPAALFMMESKTMIKGKAASGMLPSEILAEVNEGLMEHNKEQLFMTTYLMIIELSTGKVTESNAGHCTPVLYHKGRKFRPVRGKRSMALCLNEGIPFIDNEWKLKSGDKLFLYTDGVTEATNADKKLFGPEGLVGALNEVTDRSQKEIIEHVKKRIDEFVKDAPQFDDITMLGFTYLGNN